MRTLSCLPVLWLLLCLAPPAAAEIATPDRGTPVVSAGVAGQPGYVHYFRLTHPDGSQEDQLGIEMTDRRIAWSFPGAGVMVSGFVANGSLSVDGQDYGVEHRYGLRPFPDPEDLRRLQAELAPRVAFWIDQDTPYCVARQPGMPFCLNCADFVARILFPGTNPQLPAYPADFHTTAGEKPSPDDLLLYMLGLLQQPGASARRAAAATRTLPAALRQDVLAMLEPVPPAVANAAPRPAMDKKAPSRLAIRKTRSRQL